MAAAAGAGRGAVVVAPDARDVARLESALAEQLGGRGIRALTADLGPAERYRAFLEVRRGHVHGRRRHPGGRVRPGGRPRPASSSGTTATTCIAEPRAPYPHAREVLAAAGHEHRRGPASSGPARRSVEAQALVEQGWAREVVAPRTEVRRRAPRVVTVGDDDLARDEAAKSARLPHIAWDTARQALAARPGPRAGAAPRLRAGARVPDLPALARCRHCHGPLGVSSGHAVPVCGWCGRLAGDWSCAACRGTRLRCGVGGGAAYGARSSAVPSPGCRSAPRAATRRATASSTTSTAGRRSSSRPRARSRAAEGGYAAALLLDGRVAPRPPDLRAAEEAVRRWMAAASLVRPGSEGGVVVAGGRPRARSRAGGRRAATRRASPPASSPSATSCTCRPRGASPRRSAHRRRRRPARPPAPARTAPWCSGRSRSPRRADRAGPTRATPARAPCSWPRAPTAAAPALAAALKAAVSVRSARKEGGPVAVRVDPAALG